MLNISAHYDDIRRLILSRYHTKTPYVEDLVQDVCLKILQANQGDYAYQASKGSLATYILTVTRSVYLDGVKRPQVAIGEDLVGEEDLEIGADWAEGFEGYLREVCPEVGARRVFLLMRMGYTREEICGILGETLYGVKKQKALLAMYLKKYLQGDRPC